LLINKGATQMNTAELIAALKAIQEACRTTEYRGPLSHAAISDMAQAAIAKARRS
jgi:hypothetical protein